MTQAQIEAKASQWQAHSRRAYITLQAFLGLGNLAAAAEWFYIAEQDATEARYWLGLALGLNRTATDGSHHMDNLVW